MKNTKKLLALLLALVMCVGLLASCNNNSQPANTSSGNTNSPAPSNSGSTNSPAPSEPAQVTYENKVILGNTTELSGDFRFPGWGGSSAGAADQAIWFLTNNDYGTMASDQGGAYQWSDIVVKSHDETVNDDLTTTYTITINNDLKFSDGSPITIKNYIASMMTFSSPIGTAANYGGVGSQSVEGYKSYRAYVGPDGDYTSETISSMEPVLDAEGNPTGEEKEVQIKNPRLGATKEFSGVRMLDDYTCAITVSADYYGYYFSYTNGALSCNPMGLCLGEGVDIKDDGNGCYLTDNFYEQDANGDFVKAAEIAANRYDLTKYPYCGAYVVESFDEGTKEATLKINPEFKGNFEGQKPSVETIVYVKIISETQLDQLTTGAIDVLSNVTGGDETKEALAVVDGEKFAEVHYQRAGYGNIRFDCDFGPTMFQEVRQAIAYLLNRVEFCQQFTGGYGVVVDGPYSPDFTMWKAVQDEIELIDYSYSPDTAVKVLEEGGWIYNSKGEPWVAGASGVDAVRYKKLTAEEANVTTGDGTVDVNKNYTSVANTDGVTYKTVKVGDDYYMPLVINWFGTTPNNVTDMLTTALANSSDVAAAGMVIRPTAADFTTLLGNVYREPSYGYEGTPTYGMYNMADGWNSAIYDYAFNWSLDPDYFGWSVNKLYDEYDKAFPYDLSDPNKLTYEEAMAASGGKLGMDYLSMAMVYNAKTEDEYNQWWMGYIERWNQLMPAIPLYSNYYYDVYNAKIENFQTSPFFNDHRAILYANVKGY